MANEQHSTTQDKAPRFLSNEVLDNMQLLARNITRELGLRPVRGHFSDLIVSEHHGGGYSPSL